MTPDEVRRFQLHLIESGPSICNRDPGVRFLFRVSCAGSTRNFPCGIALVCFRRKRARGQGVRLGPVREIALMVVWAGKGTMMPEGGGSVGAPGAAHLADEHSSCRIKLLMHALAERQPEALEVRLPAFERVTAVGWRQCSLRDLGLRDLRDRHSLTCPEDQLRSRASVHSAFRVQA